MDNMNITSAQYISDIISDDTTGIKAVIDGQTVSVPLSSDNRHYAEILRQVADGTITITAAD